MYFRKEELIQRCLMFYGCVCLCTPRCSKWIYCKLLLYFLLHSWFGLLAAKYSRFSSISVNPLAIFFAVNFMNMVQLFLYPNVFSLLVLVLATLASRYITFFMVYLLLNPITLYDVFRSDIICKYHKNFPRESDVDFLLVENLYIHGYSLVVYIFTNAIQSWVLFRSFTKLCYHS